MEGKSGFRFFKQWEISWFNLFCGPCLTLGQTVMRLFLTLKMKLAAIGSDVLGRLGDQYTGLGAQTLAVKKICFKFSIFSCISTEVLIIDFTMQLKSDSHIPKKFFIICFSDSPSKMMKNAFYFILKALFILKVFKFLS